MKLKNLLFTAAMLATNGIALAQGIPPDQWTPSERQFVENAKALYQQQGIQFTNDQAGVAVQQMRQKQGAAPRGVPESEWTSQERTFVETARRQYLANGMPFTTEQAQLSVLSMREQVAKLTGAAGAMQAFASGSTAPTFNTQMQAPTQMQVAFISEEQIAREISSWPKLTEPLSIRGRRDGFDVNGRPVLDPEGAIFNYAFDVTSGAITYAARTPRGVVIKTISGAPNAQPLLIAQGVRGQSGWELQTVTGKQLSGVTLTVLADGFLVGRSASAFRYQNGKGVQSIAIPEGYFITPLQRGNVGATGVVLLEKEGATGNNDPMASLFSSARAIGSIIGVNKKEDYVLMQVNTGKLYPINLAADGKQVTLMSQCRQVNWVLSECQRAQSFESVFGTDGMKNNSHYYWRVNWVGTPSGPVAFTLEDGLAKLYITDLNTGKKAIAFERGFGIADWTVEQGGDAIVSLKAKLGFDWKEMPDAVSFLRSSQ